MPISNGLNDDAVKILIFHCRMTRPCTFSSFSFCDISRFRSMTPTAPLALRPLAPRLTAAENLRFDPAFGGMLPGAEPQR